MKDEESAAGSHPSLRLYVIIEGRVQGVGFRYAAYDQAVALGLNGWVRNRADGRVEAEFEGPRDPLERMLQWCHRGPRLARVDHVESTWEDCGGKPRHATFEFRGS